MGTDSTTIEENIKKIDAVLEKAKKRKYRDVIFRLGEKPKIKVDAIPTSSIALNQAIGVGGFPRGRMTEIVGPESAGKTTLALDVVASAQKMNLAVCFIDPEFSFDPDYATALGIDVNKEDFIVSQPDYLEQAFEIIEACARSKIDLVVFDGIVSCPPKAELEGEMGESHVGLQARTITQAIRMMLGAIMRNNTAFVYTNQLREKIGGFQVGFGGPRENIPGGRALRFLKHLSIDVRRIETLKDKGEPYAIKVRARIKKNKLAVPFKVAEYTIILGEGISPEKEAIELGVELGVCWKRGAYYYLRSEEQYDAQGELNAINFLKDNPDVTERIRKEIQVALEPKEVEAEEVGHSSQESTDA